MNNFNITRLGKTIVNDLRRVWQNYGYSLLILILMPAIFCLIYTFMPLLFGSEFNQASPWARVVVLTITMVSLIVSCPNKVYGNLTDKRFGTDYLMLPASTLEKFISMVVVIAVIVPVVFFVGYMAVDAFLSLVGLYKGGTLLAFIAKSPMMDNEYVTINLWNAGYFSLALNMLVFLLGAIYFKKGKTALTILSLFAIAVVISSALAFIAPHVAESRWFEDQFINGILPEWLENHVDHLGLYLNLVINFIRTVEFVIVGSLIYVRLKTLKH